MAERCEVTELLVEQCACPQHRGGSTPQEQADAERLQLRARLLAGSSWTWRASRFDGACVRCHERYRAGAAIAHCEQFGITASHGSPWIAECCAEEVERG